MVFRVRSVEEAAPLRRQLLGHAPPAGFGYEQPLPAVSLSARCGAWQIKSWASGEVRTHVSGFTNQSQLRAEPRDKTECQSKQSCHLTPHPT